MISISGKKQVLTQAPNVVRSIIAFVILTLLLISPCQASITQPDNNITARIEYSRDQYRLGPGDILSFQVLHESEYTQDNILVRPDGRATLVGVGEIDVADRSISDVTEEIKEALSRTILNPKVTLTVKNTRPVVVYLSGAVIQPGMFQFSSNGANEHLQLRSESMLNRTDSRLTNVLANAGGVQLNADISKVTVTRRASRSAAEQTVVVDLWKVIKEGDLSQDIWINPGDHIKVPEIDPKLVAEADYQLLLSSSIGPKEFPVRVIGEVKTPGVYMMNARSPYLNSAVSQAGGYAPQANRNVVAIRRFSSDKTFDTLVQEVKTGDITLQPNDVVYVSESKMYVAGRFFEQALKILSPFQSVGITGAAASQILGVGGWERRFRY